MLKAISSHVFLDHRLHPGLLDVFARAGAQGVELFAARQHFDYTSDCRYRRARGAIRDAAGVALQPAREREAAVSHLSRRDGSIQGVAHVKSVTPEVFETLKHLTQESSVIVTGKVRADKRAPGGYELDVEDVQVVQRVPESTRTRSR
jgi:hypothetical protein